MAVISLATLLLLQANVLGSATPASAVIACQSQMMAGTCTTPWRNTILELRENGSGNITVNDASGQPIRWAFSCSIDRIERTRTCSLQGGTGGGFTIFRIFTSESGSTNGLTWGGSKFPGSEMVARIGRFPIMRWSADSTIYGSQANRVIDAAKHGGAATFRWFDWPYETRNDIEVDFEGFSSVWDLFKAAVEDQRAN